MNSKYRIASVVVAGILTALTAGCANHVETTAENAEKPAAVQSQSASAARFAPIPEAGSSFGAAVSGGWLYVYGGHLSTTHTYSTESVSGRFHRLNLTEGKTWEELPGGPHLQGMNLVAHRGKIYRLGGMQPLNKPGDKSDNHSVSECAVFNPVTKQWEPLPPMPEARSSYDAAVVGEKLIVVGGWDMRGAEKPVWSGTLLVLDLAAATPQWQSVKQPFERRALIVASHHERLYVLGGLVKDGESVRDVDIYDPQINTWTSGPELPKGEHNGFAPAACTLGGSLFVSVADGTVIRLDEASNGWVKIGATEPRVVHRMVPFRSQLLVIGGAAKARNLAQIDVVETSAKATQAPASGAASGPANTPAAASTAQKVCPVMTDETVSSKESIVVEYKGTKVYLCCDHCLEKWQADPEAYLQTQFLPQLAGQSLPARPMAQVFCPVYKDRVVSEKDPFVMYKGQKIYLFNQRAVKKWMESPEKYADPKLLPQLSGVN